MKPNIFLLNPSPSCPFSVEAVQYVASQSHNNGFTLVFLHPMNLHKETFAPMLQHLLAAPSDVNISINDAWCIENPNHGRSAALNRKILSTPQYLDKWSAFEYCRAAHAFLSSTSHGVDFSTRKLVGVGHSAAAASLMLLQRMQPTLKFHGLILLDPAILPVGTASTKALCSLFGNWARSKPDTWESRSAALTNLSNTAFRQWNPRAIELFVENALRPLDRSDAVTLACSAAQEAAYYLSPEADLVDRPTEIFLELTQEDRLPIHMIVCLNDGYKGKTTEMKQFQIDHIRRTITGSVQVVEGGHMFPQVEPVICAQAIQAALGKLLVPVEARL